MCSLPDLVIESMINTTIETTTQRQCEKIERNKKSVSRQKEKRSVYLQNQAIEIE